MQRSGVKLRENKPLPGADALDQVPILSDDVGTTLSSVRSGIFVEPRRYPSWIYLAVETRTADSIAEDPELRVGLAAGNSRPVVGI